MQHDLFSQDSHQSLLQLSTQAFVLKGFARERDDALWQAVQEVVAVAPWRQLLTPGGRRMSVQTTNCGRWGWLSDAKGYRYERLDPLRNAPWPAMPEAFLELAKAAATAAGFANFEPDACLINRYQPGTRMGLHQDRDEDVLEAPIVSVSLGLSAQFLWGGEARSDRPQRIVVNHGDVVVWGGVDRLKYHGIATIMSGSHPLLGEQRINLTFRRAK
ncbi:DNA oxidative demethylase AlkB [Pseudidiomarina homiensis]|uniref:DNA oxidative demethylase AlkB n=1 Tax=Pseudidiomarina homiensis TaxID=364198 RepID=UPI00215B38A1|nr:DNA oxidative demethylase AlkB [Pseudidiomarina homiensis]